ncbi:MAG: hypothetical protein RIQ71_763 [Verrucomicrobiota bacterium]|jgi:hypothetical protein
MTMIATYLDNNAGVDFTPHPNPQLLFRAWLSHGPGHSEDLSFFVGPNAENSHEVLWLESDYAEGTTAIAWVPCGVLSESDVKHELLAAYWRREKEENESEEPNFTEVVKTPSAALTPREVCALAEQVWPKS